MATITKIKGSYRARIRRKGYPTLSKYFQYRSDARTWAEMIERAIATGTLNIAEGTLGDLLKRYKSEITPKKRSAEIEFLRIDKINKSWISDVSLSDLMSFHIAKYRDERLKEVQANACARDLSLISDAINTAMKEWNIKLSGNPVQLVKKPQSNHPRDRRLEGNEEDRLLKSCEKSGNIYLLALVILAIETGMRRGELLGLQRKDVNLTNRTAYLPMTKNGSPRTVPLSTRAVEVSDNLPIDLSGQVFPVSITALRGLWTRACKRAGIKDLHFHDLRHEATSRFFEKGLNVMAVGAITGHKDLRMLQRYTHLRAEDLAMKLG